MESENEMEEMGMVFKWLNNWEREREAVGRETEKLEETGDHSWFFPKRVSGWKDIIPKDPRKELEGGRGGESGD